MNCHGSLTTFILDLLLGRTYVRRSMYLHHISHMHADVKSVINNCMAVVKHRLESRIFRVFVVHRRIHTCSLCNILCNDKTVPHYDLSFCIHFGADIAIIIDRFTEKKHALKN